MHFETGVIRERETGTFLGGRPPGDSPLERKLAGRRIYESFIERPNGSKIILGVGPRTKVSRSFQHMLREDLLIQNANLLGKEAVASAAKLLDRIADRGRVSGRGDGL